MCRMRLCFGCKQKEGAAAESAATVEMDKNRPRTLVAQTSYYNKGTLLCVGCFVSCFVREPRTNKIDHWATKELAKRYA